MQYFRAEEMQDQADLIQEEALKEPVFLTRGDRFALVLMSMEEYDRLRGRRRDQPRIVELPDSLLSEIEAMAEGSLPEVATAKRHGARS